MERVHAPLLMQPLVQVLVVALFITGEGVIRRQDDAFMEGGHNLCAR
jgi:hypothetical protein